MTERKRDFRWVRLVVFLVLIVVVIAIIIVVKNTYFSKKADDSSTSVSVEDGKNKEPEVELIKDEKNDVEQKEKVPQYSGESPNKSENLTGLISYAGVNGGNLVIRVNIDQFLSDGNCSLNLLKDGSSTYSQTVAIQESVTTSTCDGFEIPVARLSDGELAIEVILDSGNRSGKIVGEVYI